MLDYKSLDIDWFCFINGFPIHVASNGGELPKNLYSTKEFENIFNLVQNIESKPLNWRINLEFVNSHRKDYNYINKIDELEQKKFLLSDLTNTDESIKLDPIQIAYSWSFIEMAKKGFFSFDRVEGNRYRLVAFPSFPFNLEVFRKISFPISPLAYLDDYYWRNEGMLKVGFMMRHLFTKQKFSFGLDEDIDLIDLINSIIASE